MLESIWIYTKTWVVAFVGEGTVDDRNARDPGRTLDELEDDFRTCDNTHFAHEAPAGVHGS